MLRGQDTFVPTLKKEVTEAPVGFVDFEFLPFPYDYGDLLCVVWDAILKAGPVALGTFRTVSTAQSVWESKILLGSRSGCVTGALKTQPGNPSPGLFKVRAAAP